MTTDRDSLAQHRKSGCCVDERRKNVVCTVLGSTCNNCGKDYEYCSENNVLKEDCDCNENRGKWVITPWLKDEIDIDEERGI